MGNDCVKSSGSSMSDDLRMTEGSTRNTYKQIKQEKQRRQYYLNMNAEAAEKSLKIDEGDLEMQSDSKKE